MLAVAARRPSMAGASLRVTTSRSRRAASQRAGNRWYIAPRCLAAAGAAGNWGVAMRKVVVSLAGLLLLAGAAPASAAPKIDTLSTRADLVSAGDVLVAVDPAGSKVSVDGRDVT